MEDFVHPLKGEGLEGQGILFPMGSGSLKDFIQRVFWSRYD